MTRWRRPHARTAAVDDDSTLERDVLLNLMAVFLVLLGAPAMIAAAQAAEGGAARDEKPLATIYIDADSSLRLDTPDAVVLPLEDVVAGVERARQAGDPTRPVVICHAPDVPAEHLFRVLQQVNLIPDVKTYLALRAPGSNR